MLAAVAAGALIGLVLAFTGAGGGILSIPLLVLVLQLPVQQAAPAGLAAVGIASALGAIVGLRAGVVRYRAAMLIGALGAISAPIGVALAQVVPQAWLLLVFSLVLAWVAWHMLRPAHLQQGPLDPACRVNPQAGRLVWTSPCARALALTGGLSGLLSGLLGVGGGFVIVPALTRHTDLEIRSVQATSLAVIALVSVSGVSAAVWHGSMPWGVAAPFTAGAAVMLLVGQRLAAGVRPELLRQAFAWFGLFVAVLMLYKAWSLR